MFLLVGPAAGGKTTYTSLVFVYYSGKANIIQMYFFEFSFYDAHARMVNSATSGNMEIITWKDFCCERGLGDKIIFQSGRFVYPRLSKCSRSVCARCVGVMFCCGIYK